jgi:hypothetical protein
MQSIIQIIIYLQYIVLFSFSINTVQICYCSKFSDNIFLPNIACFCKTIVCPANVYLFKLLV